MYECHITLSLEDAKRAADIADKYGWKTSAIDGDPVLGAGVNAYWTIHHNSLLRIHDHLLSTLVALGNQYSIRPIREKIELIVYDTKTGIGMGA